MQQPKSGTEPPSSAQPNNNINQARCIQLQFVGAVVVDMLDTRKRANLTWLASLIMRTSTVTAWLLALIATHNNTQQLFWNILVILPYHHVTQKVQSTLVARKSALVAMSIPDPNDINILITYINIKCGIAFGSENPRPKSWSSCAICCQQDLFWGVELSNEAGGSYRGVDVHIVEQIRQNLELVDPHSHQQLQQTNDEERAGSSHVVSAENCSKKIVKQQTCNWTALCARTLVLHDVRKWVYYEYFT